jgi:hypothetical protein
MKDVVVTDPNTINAGDVNLERQALICFNDKRIGFLTKSEIDKGYYIWKNTSGDHFFGYYKTVTHAVEKALKYHCKVKLLTREDLKN